MFQKILLIINSSQLPIKLSIGVFKLKKDKSFFHSIQVVIIDVVVLYIVHSSD